jgi:hypothetical protein
VLEENRHFLNTLLGLFTSLETQYFEINGRWFEEDEWWLSIHIHLLSNLTLYQSDNLSEMTVTDDSFISDPELITDAEFISWIADQLDKILNHSRPLRYPEIRELWRGRIGEIHQLCGMFLGKNDMNVSIH